MTIKIEIVHGESAKRPGHTIVQAQLKNHALAKQDDAEYGAKLRELAHVVWREGGMVPPQISCIVGEPEWPADVRRAAEACREHWTQWARENGQDVEIVRDMRPANSKI
jgi:hypothetical protein